MRRRVSIIVPMLCLTGAAITASRQAEPAPSRQPASQAQPAAERPAPAPAPASASSSTKAVKSPAASTARAGADFEHTVKPFIDDHCLDCHSAKKHKGNLNLEAYQTHAQMLGNAEQWEEVVRRLRAGEMPPEDEPRPDAAKVARVTKWVSGEIERAEIVAARDPGRVTTRRLNRTEYNNSLRDLLGVDLRPADDFPLDDSGYGFDNIGDVLSVSPVLMDRYVAAADRVVHTALFGVEKMAPTLGRLTPGSRQVESKTTALTDYDVTGLGLPNALHGAYQFPVDADYLFKVSLGGLRPAGSEPLPITLWIDGTQVAETTLDTTGGASFFSDRQDFSGKLVEFKLRVTAGRHAISAAVPRLYEGLPAKYNGPNPSKLPLPPPEEFKPPKDATPERIARSRAFFEARQKEIVPVSEPRISVIDIAGPYDQAAGASDESLSRVYVCGHLHGEHQPACARTIVSSFARRAFRRPVGAAEVDRYVKLVDLAKEQGDSFEEGIAVALQGILVSPDFLFRIEQNPARLLASHGASGAGAAAAAAGAATKGAAKSSSTAPVAALVVAPISQHELATRLSYFLWASVPDAALMRAADRGTLRTPAVLNAQVRRMLQDPRARSLAEEFGGQWLQFRALESLTRDKDKFPEFEDYLRLSMKRETELFFEHIIRDDRSILEFLDSNYTYVNERLARHYGMRGITGPEFRRVDLRDPALTDGTHGPRRGGVLTQASVLTVSSYATRTSTVLRGKWVLDNLLGAPPKDPPPDIPNLDETQTGQSASLRQQMEAHRKNAICASCHKRMDPLGFGLENYDATGRWRTQDGTFPIDASGDLPDGRSFTGPDELRAILSGDKEAFTRCLTGKLLTYALGRGLEQSDRHAVKTIARRVATDDYRFASLILGIVESRPFQMRRAVMPNELAPPTPPARLPTQTADGPIARVHGGVVLATGASATATSAPASQAPATTIGTTRTTTGTTGTTTGRTQGTP